MKTPKIHWFIQDGNWRRSEERNLHSLKLLLEESGCQIVVGKYIPFDGMEYTAFPAEPDGPVVIQGSIELLRNAVGNAPARWFPAGDWFRYSDMHCCTYYPLIGKYLLQQQYGVYPLGDMPRLKDFIFKTFSTPGDTPSLGRLIFVRPDSNDKCFTGECVGEKSFQWWYDEIRKDVSSRCPVVVAPFQQLHREWRLVIANEKPVAASLYKVDDHHLTEEGCPVRVKHLAMKVAKLVHPAPVWVLDIAETTDGRLAVVELGAVNCAGWYDCELLAVVDAINKAALDAWKELKKHEEVPTVSGEGAGSTLALLLHDGRPG